MREVRVCRVTGAAELFARWLAHVVAIRDVYSALHLVIGVIVNAAECDIINRVAQEACYSTE